MEDEAAEIELLEQNLNKTRQISQRMFGILTNFDSRIRNLEKNILPLHASTQVLFRRNDNIDSVLKRIDDVASSKEDHVAEEAVIVKGPQIVGIDQYAAALEHLNGSIAFKGASEETENMARLVETGARKLAQHYTALVAEASSGTLPTRTSLALSFPGEAFIPPTAWVPFEESTQETLAPVIPALRAQPIPSTHPSHPTARAIERILNDAQHGYADMRANWIKRCIEPEARRLGEGRTEGFAGVGVDPDDPVANINEGREIGIWAEALVDIAENEYSLLTAYAILTTPSVLSVTYSVLIAPITTLLSNTLVQLMGRVRKALTKRSFLALSAHAYLSGPRVLGRWDDIVRRRCAGAMNDKTVTMANVDALKEGLHSLRAVCLRSFPEFLADIKSASIPAANVSDIGTDVAEITEQIVKYLTSLPSVLPAVGPLLVILGDGNWKMGEGLPAQGRGQAAKLGNNEADSRILVEHYCYDIVMTTLSTLITLSRASRRPTHGSTFLLNNVSFLLTSLLSPSAAPGMDPDTGEELPLVSDLLAPPAQNAIQSGFRTAKAGYFDANYSPLLHALGDSPGMSGGLHVGGGAKASTKDKFTRFYELLEELIERHKGVSGSSGMHVLPDDSRARSLLTEEAVKLVVPSLQRFMQRNKDFSKNPQKYIKMNPEEMEKLIRRLY